MEETARDLDLVLDGVRLCVRSVRPTAARGRPALVFLHDSLGSISLWRDFPERLAREVGLGALAYDRRGHGASAPFANAGRTDRYLHDEAAVLERVLEECEVDEAVLFGHSDGGSIALLAASLHPRRVRGVIAEAAHVFVEDRTIAGIRAAEEALRTTDLLARLARHHGDKAEALVAAWMGTWLSPGFRGWNIERELTHVTCPVLVLQGALDEYGTEAQVRAIAAGVSGPATTYVFPALRHTPHRDAPDEVIRVAAGFVKERVIA